MSRFYFLLSVCTAVLVYVCISVLFGQEGMWAYNQLQKQKITLTLSVERLEDLNEQLVTDRNALQRDTNVIAAYAKKMGFIYPDEHLIKISGMPESPVFVYEPGSKVVQPEIIFVPEWIAKSISFLVFVFFNLIYSLVCVARRYDPAKV